MRCDNIGAQQLRLHQTSGGTSYGAVTVSHCMIIKRGRLRILRFEMLWTAYLCGVRLFAAGVRRTKPQANNLTAAADLRRLGLARRHCWLVPSRRTSGDGFRVACGYWRRCAVPAARGHRLAELLHRREKDECCAFCSVASRLQQQATARGIPRHL